MKVRVLILMAVDGRLKRCQGPDLPLISGRPLRTTAKRRGRRDVGQRFSGTASRSFVKFGYRSTEPLRDLRADSRAPVVFQSIWPVLRPGVVNFCNCESPFLDTLGRGLIHPCQKRKEEEMGARGGELEERLRAIEEQIEKLRRMRRRWATWEGLSEEEKARRDLTLELLDGAIQDLQRKKLDLQRTPT